MDASPDWILKAFTGGVACVAAWDIATGVREPSRVV